jgi:heavy metal translocating P-type ATPase
VAGDPEYPRSHPEPPVCRHCELPLAVLDGEDGGDSGFCCFGCRIAFGLARPATSSGDVGPPTTLVLRLGLGIFFALNIMAFSGVFYSREIFAEEAARAAPYGPLQGLLAYLLMLLASGVVVTLAFPLLGEALGELRGRRYGADHLIVIGVFAAYALSAIHVVHGRGSLYFDTVAVVLVVVTLGRLLEATAKRRAAQSVGSAIAELPRRIVVRRAGEDIDVDRADVAIGDTVRARAGETIGVDGVVVDGEGFVDESSLRGESRPRAARSGDSVLAGTTSLDGTLWVQARALGPDTAVAQVRALLARSRGTRPAIQRVADRIAGAFVPFVIVLALVVFGWHARGGDTERGLFDALSVLLISCPCSLGLAAPLSTWTALRRAANAGVLVDSAETLEKASRVRQIFFDKTGTLTEPQARLSAIETACGVDRDEALAIAASLEAESSHPFARAFLDAWRGRGALLRAGSPRTLPGIGIEGDVAGRRLRIGGPRLVAAGAIAGDPLFLSATDRAETAVYLADEERILARFRVDERLRPEAEPALRALLALGIESRILSGDRAAAAANIASALGVPFNAELLPADKVAHLRAVRERGAAAGSVGVVGDGINDAPVLAAADIGIAMGSATDLARQAGNVHLVADRLDRLPDFFADARAAVRRVRWSLAWAFAYNTIGIALAAAGRLTPVFAAGAMAASSVAIVVFSQRTGAKEASPAKPRAERSRAEAASVSESTVA